MGNVNQCVFVRFQALYGDPVTDDRDMFLDLYEQALEGFSDEILDKAAKRVIAEHVYPGWPKLGDVMKACKILAPASKQPEHFRDYDVEPPSEIQKARVDRLVQQFHQNVAATDLPNQREFEQTHPKRREFAEMQATSPNKALHMTDQGLTALSRRMTGEREE